MQNGNIKKMEKQKNELRFFEQNGFLFGEKYLAAGMSYPLHWHDYFECEILLEGTAEHRCNEEVQTIHAGAAYILTYEDIHAFRVLENARIFAIRFREDLLAPDIIRLLSEKSSCCQCCFAPQELIYIEQRIEHIVQQKTSDILYKHMISTLLSELLLMVLTHSDTVKGKPLPSLVHKAATYIRTNYQEDITLITAAKMLSITPKYLGSLFKETLHISFHDFLNSTRLRHACQMLNNTDLSVKEIAFSAGYSSVEYFLEVFKKRMGTTPTLYRTQTGSVADAE